uniref:Uncharacterized protein n=1 Tax=Ananas comosus var. bracteatus TaxID=296719 RepID=A0A6V7P2H1_ANACO|nr:unnamed protein product [Ananas comosus var. bracteatus]
MWTVKYACLPSCSFAHACEGRSLQAGTPELAYATVARPCGIGCRSGLPWGVYTTTGPLGAAQAVLPWDRIFYDLLSIDLLVCRRLIYCRCMAGLFTYRICFRWYPGVTSGLPQIAEIVSATQETPTESIKQVYRGREARTRLAAARRQAHRRQVGAGDGGRSWRVSTGDRRRQERRAMMP